MFLDSLPLFLKLVKSNALIYSFLISNNFEATLQAYNGSGSYISENSIILRDFELAPDESFEYIQITQIDSNIITILFVPYHEKYSTNKELYFGEKTIYSEYMKNILEKGIKLSNPYKYCFNFLEKQAGINLLGPKLFNFTYGSDICKNF